MPKKEFSVRNYSKRMFPLCTAGGIAVVLSNFVQYMVKEAYHTVAYTASYGAVVLVSVAIFCVRNQYNDKFCQSHKVYAVLAGLSALAMLAVRIIRPDLLDGQWQSLFGSPIDVGILATFVVIVLVGKPMLDIVDTMKYVEPAPTHIPREEED